MFRTIKILLLLFALFSVSSCLDDYSLETCLRKDSISCLQIHIYKKIQALLSQKTINLLVGFRIVKENFNKSDEIYENNAANDKKIKVAEIDDRQKILENFIFKELVNFFKHRTIEWNITSAIEQVTPIAKTFFSSFPKSLQRKIGDYNVEGRGKKKRLKMFMAILVAIKTKCMLIMNFFIFKVAMIAKKALVMSIIALVMSIILAVKKHSETIKGEKGSHYEIHGETLHSVPVFPVSWSSGSSINSGQEPYDSYASQQGPTHFMAYAAQKPNF